MNLLRPTEKLERISSVDALRGFALLGILLANIPYGGEYGISPEDGNGIVWIFNLLISNKFISIFSMLFGFGFYIQLTRAEKKGIGFRHYFILRMLLLFAIGCLHAYLLWFGDILRTYALGGLLLLLVYKWPLKRLLVLAIIFNVFLTGIVYIGNSALDWRVYDYDYFLAAEHYITPSYLRYLWINFTIDPWMNFLQDMPLTIVFTFGNMLLGLVLAKIDFFRLPQRLNRMSNVFILLGATLGIASSYVYTLLMMGKLELDWSMIWLPFVLAAGLVMQSLFYISTFLRLYRVPLIRKFLKVFDPVGKTALSNYIFQTLLYIGLFFHLDYTLKLHGQLDNLQTFLLGFALFAFQVLISNLWLKHFRQGPVEYAWKSFAYRFVRQKTNKSLT